MVKSWEHVQIMWSCSGISLQFSLQFLRLSWQVAEVQERLDSDWDTHGPSLVFYGKMQYMDIQYTQMQPIYSKHTKDLLQISNKQGILTICSPYS